MNNVTIWQAIGHLPHCPTQAKILQVVTQEGIQGIADEGCFIVLLSSSTSAQKVLHLVQRF